ncbi:hypothetical protein BD626DRAFT_405530 [Schizophyllum amplum]|uniref:Uncharacterized protein n=1 Tax=Schizophyllum amplum TaxID=97359 RepID=A0A550CA01_9AGAR|nr:hypothetical protein BD626DRAFT_405530 [Auriculariopsis ampla]
MRRKYSNADSDDQMQRPGSPESSTHLIPKSSRNSVVYTNYEASINSLNDILDRDDRASLAELHQYLLDDRAPASPGVGKRTSTSSAGSRKSERRRSLPVQAALEATSPTMSEMEKPDVTDFQWRRRKAAKLTQFFGVNHREVIDEVLNSFEHGLEFERDRGNIDIEEAEDLLRKIRHIKSKRSSVT